MLAFVSIIYFSDQHGLTLFCLLKDGETSVVLLIPFSNQFYNYQLAGILFWPMTACYYRVTQFFCISFGKLNIIARFIFKIFRERCLSWLIILLVATPQSMHRFHKAEGKLFGGQGD